jgi:uncharacterized cupin superfamily protein
MPERPRPNLDGVRELLRNPPESEAEPRPATPRISDGPSAMRDGVSLARIEPEAEERFQTLRRELGVSAFGLNVLRLRPGQRSRIHRHERQEEVYVVLEGTLSLATGADEEQALERGTVARVGPDVRRQLTNRGSDLLVILAIGGAEPHEGRDGVAYETWEDEEGRSPQEVPLPPDLEL